MNFLKKYWWVLALVAVGVAFYLYKENEKKKAENVSDKSAESGAKVVDIGTANMATNDNTGIAGGLAMGM